jgi:hypothetical protein
LHDFLAEPAGFLETHGLHPPSVWRR